MVRVFVFLAALQVFLVVLALISCLSAEQVRTMPRALWVLTILLIPLLGPAAYFIAGRPLRRGSRLTGSRPRAASPDDDPDFLRSLNAEQVRRDRELLAQWERDLHGKDDKPPRRDGDVRPRDRDGDVRPRDLDRDGDVRPRGRDEEVRPRDNEETPPTEV